MNCKPGDLAWILPKRDFYLAGRFCEVMRWAVGFITTPEGHRVNACDGAWLVKFQHPVDSKRVGIVNYWTVFDGSLRPIRPGDLHETEDERKEVTA